MYKRQFLTIPKDRIIIVDPMGEYAPLVRRLGGQVVEIAPGSPSHINPMDIQLDLDDDESPLSMKADFLLSLCELVVGGNCLLYTSGAGKSNVQTALRK